MLYFLPDLQVRPIWVTNEWISTSDWFSSVFTETVGGMIVVVFETAFLNSYAWLQAERVCRKRHESENINIGSLVSLPIKLCGLVDRDAKRTRCQNRTPITYRLYCTSIAVRREIQCWPQERRVRRQASCSRDTRKRAQISGRQEWQRVGE